jgi:hypothetical protein
MEFKKFAVMAFTAATLLGGPALAHEDHHAATQPTQTTRFTDMSIPTKTSACPPEVNSLEAWTFTAKENGKPVNVLACRHHGETDATIIVVPATPAQPS